MKQKYKSPEMMVQRGVDFHTSFLKKTIKAMIKSEVKTIEPFIYNTAFDFGQEGGGPHPVLYIGEITAKWKDYVKAKKTDKTFVYGYCIIDENGGLKMQVKMGKGGKDLELKKINKVLLKPFCKAYLVEEINTETPPQEDQNVATADTKKEKEEVQEDNTKKEDNNALVNWTNTSKNFVKESNLALKTNLRILKEFEKPMSNLKDIVVTDKFIAKAMKAESEVKDLDIYVLNLESLIKSGKAYQGKSKEADNLLSLLPKQIKQIEDNKGKIDLMIKNMEGLKKIADPKDAEIPIIDNDPIVNFLNRTRKAYT